MKKIDLTNEYLSDMIERIADRVIYSKETTWDMDIHRFDWVPGVGLYGIFRAYKSTGLERYKKFLIEWIERHKSEAALKRTVNSTAPMLTVFEMSKLIENKEGLALCIEAAEYIINDAPITVDGGLEHTVTEPVPGFSDQVWADSLFMVCIFIAKLGAFLNNKQYMDFAKKQLVIHHRLLINKNNNLYYHGWNGESRNHLSGICWGRANAWIIYSTMEILRALPDFKEKDEVEEYVKNHINSLIEVQSEGGAFRTILDDETSYEESSATGGIAAGMIMALRDDIVDETVLGAVKKAVEFIASNTDDDGTVNGVSVGTPVMKDADAYKAIPKRPTLYGQALALIAAIELKTYLYGGNKNAI